MSENVISNTPTKEKRYAGNVTKSTTVATSLILSVITILSSALAQAGITFKPEVQGAISTILAAVAVFIAGKYTKGEKAHIEGTFENVMSQALQELDTDKILDAIAEGVAKDAAKHTAPYSGDIPADTAQPEGAAAPAYTLNGGDFTPHPTAPITSENTDTYSNEGAQ